MFLARLKQKFLLEFSFGQDSFLFVRFIVIQWTQFSFSYFYSSSWKRIIISLFAFWNYRNCRSQRLTMIIDNNNETVLTIEKNMDITITSIFWIIWTPLMIFGPRFYACQELWLCVNSVRFPLPPPKISSVSVIHP